jgi:segregation and condensation protein B
MIRIVGRKEAPGRPILYGTTKEFLEVFSLPDLEALPALKDVSELAGALVVPEGADGDAATAAAAGDAAAPSPDAMSATVTPDAVEASTSQDVDTGPLQTAAAADGCEASATEDAGGG